MAAQENGGGNGGDAAAARKSLRPLEELLAEAAALREEYDGCFAKLPALEKLVEVWCARNGLREDDPIFIQVEMLGLFEIRQRAGMKGLVEIIEQQNEIVATLISELEDRMTELSAMQRSTEELKAVIASLKEQEGKLVEINGQFLEVLPDTLESIHAAAALINDKSWKSVVMTWAALVAAMGSGILIGLVVHRFG